MSSPQRAAYQGGEKRQVGRIARLLGPQPKPWIVLTGNVHQPYHIYRERQGPFYAATVETPSRPAVVS
jgi:hypothetical protein